MFKSFRLYWYIVLFSWRFHISRLSNSKILLALILILYRFQLHRVFIERKFFKLTCVRCFFAAIVMLNGVSVYGLEKLCFILTCYLCFCSMSRWTVCLSLSPGTGVTMRSGQVLTQVRQSRCDKPLISWYNVN